MGGKQYQASHLTKVQPQGRSRFMKVMGFLAFKTAAQHEEGAISWLQTSENFPAGSFGSKSKLFSMKLLTLQDKSW